MGLFDELKRRNVYRASMLYAASAWLLVQVVTAISPYFHIAEWVVRWIVVAAVIGFPLWVAFAWFYELTPEGLKRESEIGSHDAITRRTGGKLDFAIIGVLALAVVLLLTDRFVLRHGVNSEGASPVSAPVADRKSVAVLPFENLSGRDEDAYLADGLQEEVLNALARLRDIKVISRTSVMEYRGKGHNVREIGQRLGVGTVLEGSIRREGDTLRLTVQLIDARDDRHLFATNYDRDMTHVLELQSAVARQVAEALSATLSRVERGELDRVATNSGDAYDRYLRAAALYGRPVPNDDAGVVEPIRLLGEALRFDPDYADAWALLSQARVWAFFRSQVPADGEAAREAFERALALDPQLPEAKLARGLYAMYVTKNLDQALDDLGAVVRLRPSSSTAQTALGFALRRRARFAEAIEHQTRAVELDPLNENNYTHVLTTLQGLRRFPRPSS
jgi:TolB-like protein